MPADIVGTMVLHEKEGGGHELRFQEGPVISNFILADEINRATPKTQSAMLEAMQERQVSVARQTIRLPEPFIVIATQNPVEQDGTYPLPEAQLDRFMVKLLVNYPGEDGLPRHPQPHHRHPQQRHRAGVERSRDHEDARNRPLGPGQRTGAALRRAPGDGDPARLSLRHRHGEPHGRARRQPARRAEP